MKVLVWKSHGIIDVHDVSTPEKLIEQINDIIACVEDWDWLEKKVDLVQNHIDKYSDNMTELHKAFNTMKNAIGEGDDMFEDLFITELK